MIKKNKANYRNIKERIAPIDDKFILDCLNIDLTVSNNLLSIYK